MGVHKVLTLVLEDEPKVPFWKLEVWFWIANFRKLDMYVLPVSIVSFRIQLSFLAHSEVQHSILEHEPMIQEFYGSKFQGLGISKFEIFSFIPCLACHNTFAKMRIQLILS